MMDDSDRLYAEFWAELRRKCPDLLNEWEEKTQELQPESIDGKAWLVSWMARVESRDLDVVSRIQRRHAQKLGLH